ncbi:MAG: GntR family transcriptional regulator, partial [Lachnospiraceae bacterium]|nr:GntR family transcriptional regulator [Lachnospiraceae bacterium]
LAIKLSINPNTIQRAYNELENEGYVYSIPGKGSFVCPAVRQDEEKIVNLKAKLKEIAGELKFMGVSYEELVTLIKGD